MCKTTFSHLRQEKYLCCSVVALAMALFSGPALAADPVKTSMAGKANCVWFASPARSFHESAMVGNGRLGAMDFGGIDRQRIVLNESSMWSGGPYDANKYDAYQCLPEVREQLFAGDIHRASEVLNKSFRYADGVRGWGDENQFGCYQTLGDLTLMFGSQTEVGFSSPSGHAQGDGKTIEGCVDGDPRTKWCVQFAAPAVVWQAELPEPTVVRQYTLTSADDVPARDPQVWVLEGSMDGKTWDKLDQRELDGPFEKRFQAKSFDVAQPASYRLYRLTFTPRDSYFQVAEISLAGVKAGSNAPVPDDYRRELDLMTGMVTTRYTQGDVTFTRELVASKPQEVIAVRIAVSRPGTLNCTVTLSRKRDADVRVEDGVQVLAGQLPFSKPGGGGEGIKYLALLGAKVKGGKVSAGEQGLHIESGDEAVLIVSAGTSLFDKEYASTARERLRGALETSFNQLRETLWLITSST